MIKLIASDMDGTLLDSKRNLNKEFDQVLKDIKSKGIVFAAISGRDLFSLKHAFKDIEEDIVYASSNGNLIEYKGEILFENYIEKDLIKKIAPIIRKNSKHNTIYCSKTCIYSESIIPRIIGRGFKLKVKYVKDITKIDDNILKVTTFGNKKITDRSLKEILVLKDELMIVISGKTCYDICRLGGNKKQAVKVLQEKFDIKYEETMVFGDNMNDLEMMDAAYYSYAMENAKDEVKARARFIAKSNDENGVVEAIKKVVLDESEINAL